MAKGHGVKFVKPEGEEGLEFECNDSTGGVTLKVDDGDNSFSNGGAEDGLSGWSPFTSLANAAAGITSATTYLDLVLNTSSQIAGTQSFELDMKAGQPNYPVGTEEGYFKNFPIPSAQLNKLMNINLTFKSALFGNMSDNGSAYLWGENTHGELGDSSVIPKSSPVAVVGGNNFKQIACGTNHTLGLTASGAAYAWGGALRGQLGDSTQVDKSSPVAVVGGHLFKQLDAGALFSVGLTTAGDAYAWGFNNAGQLGDGTQLDKSSPVAVVGGYKFKQVSASTGNHILGLSTNGDAYAWGANGSGQLGDSTVADKSSPVAVVGGYKFKHVSAAGACSLGLTTDGDAYAWGANSFGQLGDGTQISKSSPVAVVGGYKFKKVVAGGQFSLGLTHDGLAYAWGQNSVGQLGDGTQLDKSSPVAVVGGYKFVDINAGDFTAYGLTKDGDIYAWGSNASGQLGDSTVADKSSPVAVVGGYKFKSLGESTNDFAGGITYGSYAQFILYNADTNAEILRSEPLNLNDSAQSTYSFNKYFTASVLNYRLAVVVYNSGA